MNYILDTDMQSKEECESHEVNYIRSLPLYFVYDLTNSTSRKSTKLVTLASNTGQAVVAYTLILVATLAGHTGWVVGVHAFSTSTREE